ncbi:hypothetical protein JCM30760_27180 [Thiomicrorhabdus hydrogeniphila]
MNKISKFGVETEEFKLSKDKNITLEALKKKIFYQVFVDVIENDAEKIARTVIEIKKFKFYMKRKGTLYFRNIKDHSDIEKIDFILETETIDRILQTTFLKARKKALISLNRQLRMFLEWIEDAENDSDSVDRDYYEMYRQYYLKKLIPRLEKLAPVKK